MAKIVIQSMTPPQPVFSAAQQAEMAAAEMARPRRRRGRRH